MIVEWKDVIGHNYTRASSFMRKSKNLRDFCCTLSNKYLRAANTLGLLHVVSAMIKHNTFYILVMNMNSYSCLEMKLLIGTYIGNAVSE